MYEYKIVPAPRTGLKIRGAKTPEARFAAQIEASLNATARDGWEYVRAETLPCEARAGLTAKTTRFHSLLVFRRPMPSSEIQPDQASDAARVAPEPPAAPKPLVAVPPEASPEMLSVLRELKGPRPDPDADAVASDAPRP